MRDVGLIVLRWAMIAVVLLQGLFFLVNAEEEIKCEGDWCSTSMTNDFDDEVTHWVVYRPSKLEAAWLTEFAVYCSQDSGHTQVAISSAELLSYEIFDRRTRVTEIEYRLDDDLVKTRVAAVTRDGRTILPLDGADLLEEFRHAKRARFRIATEYEGYLTLSIDLSNFAAAAEGLRACNAE